MRTQVNRKDVNAYILNAIDADGYELPTQPTTDAEKLQFLADTFKSEYLHHNNERGHRLTLFAEWMCGLPSSFNVDFENYRILEIAKEWGSLPNNATEKQEDRILNKWWDFIAAKTFMLMRKNNIAL